MKIAIYIPSWPAGSAANGIVTYGAHMVPALRRLGHEVFVITSNKTSKEQDNFLVDLNGYHRGWSLRERLWSKIAPESTRFCKATTSLVLAVKDLVAAHGIDVVEIEESFGWSYALSRLRLVPVIVRLHGPWFMTGPFGRSAPTSADIAREKLEGRGIKSADAITAPSNYVLQSVRTRYRLSPDDGVVYSNPLDAVATSYKWRLDCCDKNSLLYVGRFDELKGGDLVLQSFAVLAAIYPDLKLTFVGPDLGVRRSSADSILFEDYARTVLPEETRSRVIFKGKLSQSEVASLRTAHFATLCASRTEMLPYSILEAMSFGCPVVASAVGGVPEIVQSGKNGLLFSSQDIPSFVRACGQLLENHLLAARLGEQAWHDCRERYRPDTLAQLAVGVYGKAIERFGLNHDKCS